MVKKATKKKAKKVGRPEGAKLRSFVFIGDPNDNFSGHGWIYMHGYQFNKGGKGTKVSNEVAAKLETHSHFKEA